MVTRYQRVIRIRISKDRQYNGHKIPKGGNQNPYIEGQTIQWSQDTKGVIRIRISKDRQYNGHKIPKGGNQNPYIEGQTIQWSQDTKGR
jgi:hypothetical protein